jgi:hypothetical protein
MTVQRDADERELASTIEGPGFDVREPNAARIYDFMLGGKDNFAADRAAAEQVVKLVPDAPAACRENRRFLGRAVRFLTEECGIRQFLDIGTGLPTVGNVHEAAQETAADAHVAYVDYDPLVINHARARLVNDITVKAIQGDLREPEAILAHPEIRELINFGRPLAILLVAVLHFVREEEEPGRLVQVLKDAMPVGSYLVLTHITADGVPEDISTAAQRVYDHASAPAIPRSLEVVTAFFDGLTIVEPGVANVQAWRPPLLPYRNKLRSVFYGGVGMKQP